MKWGVFDRRESFDHTVHVAPCDNDGRIMAGHRVLLCDCQPKLEVYGDFTLVIHREES
jgi:hypothetical protein